MGHHKHEACKSRAKSKFKFMLNDENAEGNPLFMTEYWKKVIRKKTKMPLSFLEIMSQEVYKAMSNLNEI